MSSQAEPLEDLNRVLKQTPITYLDRARAYPFVKWAGGKRSLIPEIVKVLPPQFRHYYEPFVGGGAVFFSLDSRIQSAYLSDINVELMITYKVIETNPDKLIDELVVHSKKHNKPHYLSVRKNGHGDADPVRLAARFIYMNRTCYNGLYRVNNQGKFNVPMGSYKKPKICDEDNIRATSEVLKKATIKFQSFEDIEPGENDLVYCDPPYHETFDGYTDRGFDENHHRTLREACVRWRNDGAYVIVSNNDTSLIRSLYKNFRLIKVQGARNISCKGDEREKASELLILGY